MSVASVITLGYKQGVKFLPTLGYLAGSAPPAAEQITGRGGYTYVAPFQREEYQRQEIKKQKTELQKLESVLQETERLKQLAIESKLLAQQRNALQRAIELEQRETDYLNEINRLLMVRAGIMQRIRQSEEMLIALVAMRRRRLRAGNWQVN